MSKARVALSFGDGPNDTRGRGEDFGMYDNGVWENVLGVPFSPGAGPRNREGIKSPEALAAWLTDNRVDVLIYTMWLLAPWVARLKKMAPNCKVVGLTDHPLDIDIKMSRPQQVVPYIQNIEPMDGLMVLTPREAAFYGGLHKNVHLVGLPFPHRAYERLRVPPKMPLLNAEGKPTRPAVIGLGVGGPGWCAWDRNYVATAYAFRMIHGALAAKGIDCEGVWLSSTVTEGDPYHVLQSGTRNTRIQRRTDMETYLATLQSCDAVISNITRDTPGRLVAEAAFFGVPCVGSNSLSLQGELFPTLAHDPYDIISTVEATIDLIEHGAPPSLVENARRGLEQYDFEHSRERFRAVLRSLGFDPEWEPAT